MKMSRIDTQNDKNPKFSNIQRFYSFFSKLSTDFVNWKDEKGQQGKNALSSMLRKEITAVFKRKFFSDFHYLLFSFCHNIDRLRGLECLNA